MDFDKICELNKEIVKKHNEPYGIMNKSSLLFSLDEFKENPYNQTNSYLIAKILVALTNNHCFVEGNKRTGRMVLVLILDYLNAKISLSNKEIDDLFISIAKGVTDAVLLEQTLLDTIVI